MKRGWRLKQTLKLFKQTHSAKLRMKIPTSKVFLVCQVCKYYEWFLPLASQLCYYKGNIGNTKHCDCEVHLFQELTDRAIRIVRGTAPVDPFVKLLFTVSEDHISHVSNDVSLVLLNPREPYVVLTRCLWVMLFRYLKDPRVIHISEIEGLIRIKSFMTNRIVLSVVCIPSIFDLLKNVLF